MKTRVNFKLMAAALGAAMLVSGAAHADSSSQGAGAGKATGAVPEPATWAMMIVGFGLVGGALRRRGARATA